MEEDIKILEDIIKQFKNNREIFYNINEKEIKALENLIKVYKEKDKDNNDLRRLYRRTAIKLKENGKEELADYFLAQINEVPTFVVDDDIDYYTEYYKLKEENKTYRKQLNSAFDRGFIHTDKIKEKIEEVNKSNGYSPVNKILIEQVLNSILKIGG